MARPHTTALFVRIPVSQAEKLDRAAFELRTSKQELVTGLLERYVDPQRLADDFGFGDRRRVTVETENDSLTVGRHVFRPTDAPEVLTLSDVAALLRVDEDEVEALARDGALPGRRIGGDWRFARRAVLEWLADGEET